MGWVLDFIQVCCFILNMPDKPAWLDQNGRPKKEKHWSQRVILMGANVFQLNHHTLMAGITKLENQQVTSKKTRVTVFSDKGNLSFDPGATQHLFSENIISFICLGKIIATVRNDLDGILNPRMQQVVW